MERILRRPPPSHNSHLSLILLNSPPLETRQYEPSPPKPVSPTCHSRPKAKVQNIPVSPIRVRALAGSYGLDTIEYRTTLPYGMFDFSIVLAQNTYGERLWRGSKALLTIVQRHSNRFPQPKSPRLAGGLGLERYSI